MQGRNYVSPVSQMRKPRHRKVKELAKGHTAAKWHNQNLAKVAYSSIHMFTHLGYTAS